MGEVYRPLRQRGQRMSYLIDDAMFVWKGKSLAKRMALVMLMVMTALGLFCLCQNASCFKLQSLQGSSWAC